MHRCDPPALAAAPRRRACKPLGPVAGLIACAGLGACSPDSPLSEDLLATVEQIECATVSYESFAADFFARYCLNCHNADLKGDLARSDAPNGIDFNSLESIRPFQRRIRLRAGVQGDMPPRLLPVPRPSEQERLMLIRWIDCGTPASAP